MRALLLALLMAGFASALPARAASVLDDLNRALTDGVILPGYERFADATAGLEAAVADLCAARPRSA